MLAQNQEAPMEITLNMNALDGVTRDWIQDEASAVLIIGNDVFRPWSCLARASEATSRRLRSLQHLEMTGVTQIEELYAACQRAIPLQPTQRHIAIITEDQDLCGRTGLLQQPDMFGDGGELGRRQTLPPDQCVVFRVADNPSIG